MNSKITHYLKLVGYEGCFLAAVGFATASVIKETKETKSLKPVGRTILLFLLVNLGLFLVYIPTLVLNPSINWTLKGGQEYDPMILFVFWPPVHFSIASIVIGVVGMINYWVVKKKAKVAVHSKKNN